MADRPLAFIDVETTGLDPDCHVLWEWAVIIGGTEHHGQVRLDGEDLDAADHEALRVGRFDDRYRHTSAAAPSRVAPTLYDLLNGVTLVGAQPHFDAAFIGRLIERELADEEMPWHHRLLDVESMAAGSAGYPEPRSLRETAEALGIPVDDDERHTALGDARIARAVWKHITGPPF